MGRAWKSLPRKGDEEFHRRVQINPIMKTKKDLQMLLLGLAVGVLVTLGLGAAAPKSTSPGRYQIGGTSNNALVLDTATGQV